MMTIDEAKQLATYFSVGSVGYILDFTNVTWGPERLRGICIDKK